MLIGKVDYSRKNIKHNQINRQETDIIKTGECKEIFIKNGLLKNKKILACNHGDNIEIRSL